MHPLSRRTVLIGATALTLSPASVRAQPALKIVFPFAAGNAADAVARLIAERLQRDLQRPVIVENKSGAAGRIGTHAVKDAPGDGAVLLFAVSSLMTLQPHLSDVGYDPFADFAPVSQVMTFEQAVAVPVSSPNHSLRALIAWYRANPPQAVFGSPGAGTGSHIVAVEFASAFDLNLRHAAYRGTAAALPDLFAGRIPAYFAASAELIEHHIGGRLRILAVGGAERAPTLPEVPTFRESGAELDTTGWYGLYAPARAPVGEIRKLEQTIIAIVRDPAIGARIASLGFRPTGTTADELRSVQRADFDHWGRVVSAAGLKGAL